MVTVLCVDRWSYYKLLDVDWYDADRDAWRFPGGRPVIAHPPCAQWSKLKGMAKYNESEKALGVWCVQLVKKYGGIVEQPAYSLLFDYCGVRPNYVIDQSVFGFPSTKPTWLYCVGVKLVQPIMSPVRELLSVEDLHSSMRSRMPLEFCKYLVDAMC